MRARGLARLFSLTSCVLSLAGTARAQEVEPEAVRLAVPDCLGVSGQEVVRLAALELAPRLRVVERPERSLLEGRVRCDDRGVVIEVHDPGRPSPLRVELDLAAAAPEARPRLLALSLAELLATSRLERAALGARPKADRGQAPPEPTPDGGHGSTESEAAGARDRSALQLWLAPGISRALAPATLLFGVDAGVEAALGSVALLVDVQGRLGEAAPALADVSAQALSASAAVGPALGSTALRLTLGAGLRAGYVRLAAAPARAELSGDELAGAFFGPLLAGVLRVRLPSPLALRFAVEAGYVVRPVVGLDANARELAALRGPWLSAALGLGVSLR